MYTNSGITLDWPSSVLVASLRLDKMGRTVLRSRVLAAEDNIGWAVSGLCGRILDYVYPRC